MNNRDVWRGVAIVVAGILALALAGTIPPLRQHPFALLYAYVVFAAWYGSWRQSVLAVALSVLGSAFVVVRFGGLPLEEILFVLASAGLLGLLRNLRQMRAAAEAATARMQALQAVTDTALAHLDAEDLIRQMLIRITTLLRADNAAFLSVTDDGAYLLVHLAYGPEETLAGQVRIPSGQGVAGTIATRRAPLIIDDLSAYTPVNPWLAANVRSLMGVPLLVGERLVGVLHVDMLTPRRFTTDELALLQLVADRVALVLDHARLYTAERQARALAEEAVRLRDDVLAAVSHDLKSPLATIKGHAQLLRQRAQRIHTPDGTRLVEGLERIDQTTTRMVRLINELLDAAQLQAGRALTLDLQPVDLVALARRVAGERQQVAPSHQITVEAAVPEVTGTWDAFRLERVLDNLLSNAVKYSPAGSTVTVRVSVSDDGAWAILEMRDEGRGIPASDLPHIFERFHRARNTGAARGTGLGLAGARQIVEQHGGEITIESQEGAGTTVCVRLPRMPAETGDSIAPPGDRAVS